MFAANTQSLFRTPTGNINDLSPRLLTSRSGPSMPSMTNTPLYQFELVKEKQLLEENQRVMSDWKNSVMTPRGSSEKSKDC